MAYEMYRCCKKLCHQALGTCANFEGGGMLPQEKFRFRSSVSVSNALFVQQQVQDCEVLHVHT